jgi:DNA/RNA endonuclease YhcR with UshA esterase domain
MLNQDFELNDEVLDHVAGGQEVVKLGKITVTARREPAPQVVKLEKVTVVAKRESPLSGAQVAAAGGKTARN